MKKQNVILGALILSAGGVLAKVFSAVYRIGLTRILGGVGIGLYQLVFPFYSLCVVLATAGIPLAVSKLVAKNENCQTSLLKKCFIYTSLIALTITFIFIISSKALATLQGYKELTICYLILAPSIIVISVTSVLKGFFQGKHNFTPSAVSNILEQFVKLIAGLLVSFWLISYGIIYAIIGAMVCVVASEFVSLIVLLLYLKTNYQKTSRESELNYKQLFKQIMPIMVTNIILPIASFIDSVLVVNLLNVNFPTSVSAYLYGLESGAVSSLVSLPTIFSFAIASVIMPNLAETKNEYNGNIKISLCVKIILIITVPCVVCFALVPQRLINALYGNNLCGLGLNGTAIAGRLLAISGLGVVFLSLNQLFSSSLQAIDKSNITIRNLIISVVLKFVIQLLFMPCKMLNIYALAVANIVCYITVMFLNYTEINYKFKIKINFIFAGKLVLCNVAMLLALVAVMSVKNSVANTFLAVAVAVIVYFISLCLFKVLTKKDVVLKYKK